MRRYRKSTSSRSCIHDPQFSIFCYTCISDDISHVSFIFLLVKVFSILIYLICNLLVLLFTRFGNYSKIWSDLFDYSCIFYSLIMGTAPHSFPHTTWYFMLRRWQSLPVDRFAHEFVFRILLNLFPISKFVIHGLVSIIICGVLMFFSIS